MGKYLMVVIVERMPIVKVVGVKEATSTRQVVRQYVKGKEMMESWLITDGIPAVILAGRNAVLAYQGITKYLMVATVTTINLVQVVAVGVVGFVMQPANDFESLKLKH